MIKRQKTIDTLRAALDNTDIPCIAIVGEKGIGKSTFLRELENDGFFGEEGDFIYLYLTEGENFSFDDIELRKLIIIDSEDERDETFWLGVINAVPNNYRLIFTHKRQIDDNNVENIVLGNISFREYADSQGYPIDVGKILSGEIELEKLNALKDTYLERGGFPRHLIHPDTIYDDFATKRTIIESFVFDKERNALIEFARTLAMNVGNLFKADQIAKMLTISRRKVNKYREILENEGIIVTIAPWGTNSLTETSRDSKIYFRDLSTMKVLLGDTYYQGTFKQGAIENFIYLELERKLGEDHSISFYRKKSGAEITFIAENTDTEMITPIEILLRDSEAVSQVFRTFDEDYHGKVDRYMLVNGSLAGKKDINGIPLIILPHIAI